MKITMKWIRAITCITLQGVTDYLEIANAVSGMHHSKTPPLYDMSRGAHDYSTSDPLSNHCIIEILRDSPDGSIIDLDSIHFKIP
jgi:hypothetical protein